MCSFFQYDTPSIAIEEQRPSRGIHDFDHAPKTIISCANNPQPYKTWRRAMNFAYLHSGASLRRCHGLSAAKAELRQRDGSDLEC